MRLVLDSLFEHFGYNPFRYTLAVEREPVCSSTASSPARPGGNLAPQCRSFSFTIFIGGRHGLTRLTHCKEKLAHSYSFDQLLVTVDLKNAKISSARWGDMGLPRANSAAVDVEDNLQVSVTGMLTDRSSASIRGADRLLVSESAWSLRCPDAPFSD